MINEIIGRTVAGIVIAMLLPAVFLVFVLACVVAIVKTMFEQIQ